MGRVHSNDLSSKSGMSLMAAIVGIVIMGMVMMGLVKFVQQSSRERLANNQHFESDNLRTLAKNIVKTRNNCGLPTAGAGAVIGSSVNFVNNTSNAVVPVPSLGGGQIQPATNFDSIQLNNMQLVDIVRVPGSQSGTANLRLNAVKRQRTGATADVVNDVPVQLRFSDAMAPVATIESCSSDDSDVTAATDTYLTNRLPAMVDSVISQKFEEYLEEYIDNGAVTNPTVLTKIVNNTAVKEAVCAGITGATWDEVARQCSITTVINNPATPRTPVKAWLHVEFVVGKNFCANQNATVKSATCNGNCYAGGYLDGYHTSCTQKDGKDRLSCNCGYLQ